jgi:hemerythrin
MFEWSNDYSVQITSIDAQHRNLFAIGQELHAAMMAGQGTSALAKILDRLVQYTVAHFAHEERLMQQNGYPDLAAHKAEHAALTKQVLQFQADFQSGRAAMTVQILHFVNEWLQKHIKGTDKRYVPCLTQSDLKPLGLRS